MHTTKRIARLLAAGVTTMLLLSACTPEQLDVYQKVTGDQLDAGRTGALLALDDTPWRLDDGSVIQVDGRSGVGSAQARKKIPNLKNARDFAVEQAGQAEIGLRGAAS